MSDSSLRLKLSDLFAVALACSVLASCASTSSEGCGEGGDCTSTSTIDYGTALSGPYTLIFELGSSSYVARCNAPLDMTTEDNPEFLSCDPSGFEITGDVATNHSSVTVTIQVDGEDDPYVASEDVDLVIQSTEEPNGADCDPVCYDRAGQLLVQR